MTRNYRNVTRPWNSISSSFTMLLIEECTGFTTKLQSCISNYYCMYYPVLSNSFTTEVL